MPARTERERERKGERGTHIYIHTTHTHKELTHERTYITHARTQTEREYEREG